MMMKNDEKKLNRYQKFFLIYSVYMALYDIMCVKDELKFGMLSVTLLSIPYIYFYCKKINYSIYLYFFIMTNQYAILRGIRNQDGAGVLALMTINIILLATHYNRENKIKSVTGTVIFCFILFFQVFIIFKLIV